MSTQPPSTPSPHLPVRPDWLALHTEAALEPDLPVIDAHHHLWQHANNPYLHADVLRDVAAGHNIVATAFMECGAFYRAQGPAELASVGETEYVNRVAEASAGGAHGPCRIAAAIVGNVNLLKGAAAGVALDAHVEAAPARFRGIRNSSVYHPDPAARGSLANPPPGLLGAARFRRGFACLAPRGLTFDAWMYHTQLDELTDLAGAFADTTIVLNHVGGPIGIGPYAGRRAEVFAAWKAAIHRLALRPNVVVKLGGMGMRVFGFDFADRPTPPTSQALADAWRPCMLECIEAFGAERCMFQSNFPVDKGTASYGVIWNAFKRIAADLTPAEKNALFLGTAARVYRIDVS
jgi:predicted TIM-barrel fold metal-dependent hydrolase